MLASLESQHDSNELLVSLYGMLKDLRDDPQFHFVLQYSTKLEIVFQDPDNKSWSLSAGYALNGGEYLPRLKVQMFGNTDEDRTVTGWNFLHLVGQDKLYWCTKEENECLQFQVIGTMLEIMDGIYPDLDKVPAWI